MNLPLRGSLSPFSTSLSFLSFCFLLLSGVRFYLQVVSFFSLSFLVLLFFRVMRRNLSFFVLVCLHFPSIFIFFLAVFTRHGRENENGFKWSTLVIGLSSKRRLFFRGKREGEQNGESLQDKYCRVARACLSFIKMWCSYRWSRFMPKILSLWVGRRCRQKGRKESKKVGGMNLVTSESSHAGPGVYFYAMPSTVVGLLSKRLLLFL